LALRGGAAVIFWLVEALWKSFQYMYAPRIQELERAVASDSFESVDPLQVYSSWFKQLQKDGFGLLDNARLGIVAFPHFVTVIAGVALFCLPEIGFIHLPAR
jgi:hypothetical protein